MFRGRVGLKFDHPFELFDGYIPATHLGEHPDDPPDHLPQKMRRADAEADQVAVEKDLGMIDLYDRGSLLSFLKLAKRNKVMLADEHFGSFTHRFHIQTFLDPPDKALRKRVSPGRDPIEIVSGDGVVAGVKCIRCVRHL